MPLEYNDKNLELFERLEKECPACKNGSEEFGVDNNQNVNFPFILDRNNFSDEEVFYTEYEKSIKGKERLILRWNQCTSFKVLMNVQNCIHNFLKTPVCKQKQPLSLFTLLPNDRVISYYF